MRGIGGPTPPAQLIVTTIAAGSVALIVVVWNDKIKTFLKGSFTNLLAATALMFGALAVPSLLLAGLAVCVLLLSALFRKKIWGNNLKLTSGTLVPLPQLILPTASIVYLLGAAVFIFLSQLRQPSPIPDKTVAFFAPSQLVGTSLHDLSPAEQSRLLSDIDIQPKRLMSGTLEDFEIEFHPTITPDQHLSFRAAFGPTTTAHLDYWLSQDENLKHLSNKVDVALEESAMIQNTSGNSRELIVRAYISTRSLKDGELRRVSSGKRIVAHGTVANRNDLMLVLAVRIAAKLLTELKLPDLTPQEHRLVWRAFNQALHNHISTLLDFSTNDPPTKAEDDARERIAGTEGCDTADCTLKTASALEALLQPPTVGETNLPTASAAYVAAYGQ